MSYLEQKSGSSEILLSPPYSRNGRGRRGHRYDRSWSRSEWDEHPTDLLDCQGNDPLIFVQCRSETYVSWGPVEECRGLCCLWECLYSVYYRTYETRNWYWELLYLWSVHQLPSQRRVTNHFPLSVSRLPL